MGDYLHYIGGTVSIVALTGAAAVTAAYMAFSPSPMSPQVDLHDQSCELPNSGGARQSRLAPPGGITGLLYDDAKTLLEVMQRGCKISGNGNCLGYKTSKTEYSWISYEEVIKRAYNFASGLIKNGMKPGQNSFVGIYSQNSVEWILTEHACYNQSAVIVPLYDTLGPNACSFIINHAEVNIVVCDKEEKVHFLLEKKDQTPSLRNIIVVNDVSEEVKKLAKEKNVQLNTFQEIMDLGENNPAEIIPPNPDDIATLCYTSGTTGDPKGVMLTHANIISVVSAVNKQAHEAAPKCTDIMMSFLPLAHMMERFCQVAIYVHGGSVGFFGGDIRTLMDDLKALRPTIMPAVPRLLNRIYDTVVARANGSMLKRLVFKLALRMKQSELRRFILRNDSIWDKLVFKPVREGMGGRLRLLVCGSAPLAENVLTFIRCALGCMVIEAYGQTECVAPCTGNIPGDYAAGHVGPPLPCCHIKLVDVPDLGYFSKDGQGEVCVKGMSVFKGYFKDPQKTAETVDSDGWLHTGDIGMWLPNGTLKIVDRKKHIFKLSQGEYIAPQKIENIYLSNQYVAQIFVHGESLQNCLVAVVVPDGDVLLPWCKENKIEGTWEEMCKNKAVKEFIFSDIIERGKKAGLRSFEQVKDIYVHPEMFSIDNGLLTPTLKTKRSECKKFFMDAIESMYRMMS